MSDETLVRQAEDLILSTLAREKSAAPQVLERLLSSEHDAMGGEIVGMAVLRLLRRGQIELDDNYELIGSQLAGVAAD